MFGAAVRSGFDTSSINYLEDETLLTHGYSLQRRSLDDSKRTRYISTLFAVYTNTTLVLLL